MDTVFIKEYIPMYAKAAELTIVLGGLGIAFSLIAGLLCALVQYFRLPLFKWLVNAYIELARNTPLLVQLFFLYFGLPKAGIHFSSETCAIIGMTFLGGGYMAEAFRSGLMSVDKVQKEAALAVGLNHRQAFMYVIFPQALTVSVPAFCANAVFLIKETSVFSVVALADLMFVAKDLIGLYYKTQEALLMLVTAYLTILLPVSVLAAYLERRVKYAGIGN